MKRIRFLMSYRGYREGAVIEPPAMVSGPDAPWDVPVHVISSKPALLDTIEGCGFVTGLLPGPEVLGSMHQLGPMFLYAFENSASKSGCRMHPAHERS